MQKLYLLSFLLFTSFLLPVSHTDVSYAQDRRLSATEKAIYEQGFKRGKEDYKAGKSRDFKRHRSDYDFRFERFFRDGYEDGYDLKVDRNDGLQPKEKEVYDSGYRRGRQDYRAKVKKNYRRYNDEYDPRNEEIFKKGYQAGYEFQEAVGDDLKPQEKNYYNRGLQLGQEDRRANRSPSYKRYPKEYTDRFETFFKKGYEQGYGAKSVDAVNERPLDQEVYDKGYKIGREDYRKNLNRDYKRHSKEYNSRFEDTFRRGYEAGYEKEESLSGGLKPAEKDIYNRGYKRGQQDYRDRLNRNYRRYSNEYDSRTERFFKDGYDAGYEEEARKNPTSNIGAIERQNYDNGYRFGAADRRDRLSRDYKRYQRQVESRYERIFQQGYEDGYDNRPKSY
ncbi:MAG: hypothetical protein JNN15_04760 [Blastocatellia bacterium]|nr:hypothetical protein [Blastocatellia bacterium]